ncbi:MAG: MG2 domain-containing protein, partial [Candidatus Riflebacteria bacterium]|nr:MG2 domain-containing protein [Candidatus Riflebacteria bacterium]
MNNSASAQTKVELWQKVNEAKSKGLPQTAIEHLGPIYDLALAEGDIADAVRAMCERIVLEGNIQGNKPEEKIIRLEKEISTADKSVKPLLNIVLARWYWHYYNHNSYRFMQRDRTEGMEEKDFTAWDLPKLFNHISNLYTNVLSEEESLKNISIKKLYGFIEGGNQPEKLRPTLFDFFAHEAIEFFVADIQSAAKPKNAFEIEASSPALEDSDSFINWSPKTLDDESANFKALKILQRLITIAKETNNTDALIDNDLIRLGWIRNVAVGDDISNKYINQLLNIVKSYPDNPYSATALAYAAREYVSQNDNIKALEYINQAIDNYPQTYGEQLAKVIRSQIMTKTVSIEAEKIMSPQKSQLKISFRNINKLYFKLVDRPDNTLTKPKSYSPDSVDWNDYPEIVSGYPLRKWEINIDPGKEYKTCEEIIDLPDLPKGIYYLVASVRNDFSENDNALHVAPIIVSELGIFTRKRAGSNEVFVINAKSGAPITEARVKAYSYDYNRGWEKISEGETNSNGIYKFRSKNASGFVKVEHAGDMAYMTDYFNVGRTESPGNHSERLQFFTDRAIYRPGQTIYFKGIAYSSDTNTNNYRVVENSNISVSLLDPNGQNVITESFRTNEFGSFSGTFTTPADRLTGRYSITGRGQSSLSSNSIYGQTSVRVEEYKRPKFKVDLMPPTAEFKLGDEVEMSGTAMAYNGSAIDKGVVKYRVKRQVRYPRWYWWIQDFGSSAEITHGTTTTDNDGKFVIKFKAVPDRTISESKNPVFYYEVTADVTDGNGETRT